MIRNAFIAATLALIVSASGALAQDRSTVKVGDLTVSYGDAGSGRPIVLDFLARNAAK
jgi:hypothetical protein